MFPVRWENPKTGKSGYAPACAKEWVRGVCGKPQVKCGDCPSQKFIPVTPDVIECHLRGEDRVRPNGRGNPFVAGVYPLLFDDTCVFLAVDFDGETWIEDAQAFLATCREVDVPAALERSRSGNGGHVWMFFSEPLPAAEARRLGTLLLTRTMNQRPEIRFNVMTHFVGFRVAPRAVHHCPPEGEKRWVQFDHIYAAGQAFRPTGDHHEKTRGFLRFAL